MRLLLAAADNLSHLAVGALAWLCVIQAESGQATLSSFASALRGSQPAAEVLLCAAIASLIDLDHFIQAKSFNLSDAVKLTRRPFLHLSLIPVLILLISALLRSFADLSGSVERFGLLACVAMLSHHLRDSWRKGLWVFVMPYSGKRISVPVSYHGYLLCLGTLPMVAGLYSKFRGLKIATNLLSRMQLPAV